MHTRMSQGAKQRRKVHFRESLDVNDGSCVISNPNDVWYGDQEIEEFKESARIVSKLLRQVKDENEGYCDLHRLTLESLHDEDCFDRGLEQRVDLTRTFRRIQAVRSVVQFQQICAGNELSLSIHARKCSQWARIEAYNTGLRDAKDVRIGTWVHKNPTAKTKNNSCCEKERSLKRSLIQEGEVLRIKIMPQINISHTGDEVFKLFGIVDQTCAKRLRT